MHTDAGTHTNVATRERLWTQGSRAAARARACRDACGYRCL